ncbi:hypothetical protein [Kitasatospora purpeofusca]|uniref:hypothetical protein n=1 Tax=Kitasatospora purpeofusca TaxID=67352 RepID=UPI000ADE9350|nr:hypothetical protein [Kitasatospora purpeofusca]
MLDDADGCFQMLFVINDATYGPIGPKPEIYQQVEDLLPEILDLLAFHGGSNPRTPANTGRAHQFARVAGRVAGRRRTHLTEAWIADLSGAPDFLLVPSGRHQAAMVSGYLVAAVRLRLHDTLGPAWRPVDWVIASRSRSATAVTAVIGSLALYIDVTGGLHELLTTGVQTCALAGPSLWGLTQWLRGVRGVELASQARARVREDTGTEE